MRATVGPLSASVYWRRRAVVLGAVLLGVIVLFVSCSGGDDKDSGTKNASTQYPTPAPASASPTPSFLDSAPGAGPALPDPADLQSATPDDNELPAGTDPTVTFGSTASAGSGTAALPADGTCADSELSVTPIPAAAEVKRGVPVELRIKVKNVGTRTCNRDVGSGPQELYLEQGAQKFWSSDKCNPSADSDLRSFAPGAEREYQVTWNGRQSTQCEGTTPSGPVPAAGQYELRSRLGTIISEPVTLSIVA
ncbi:MULTISPECIES: hypothetical protein [Actinoplanes]|uniref:hypothetical protein n=1 Tax=Actinoplanes TaxID=1865 RepID=UPI0005F2BA51|nr:MULTISPECIES: hypothetical protein [Actinoplanes]